MTVSVVHIVNRTPPDWCTVAESFHDSIDAFASCGVKSRLCSDKLTQEDLADSTIVHIHRWGYEAAIDAAKTASAKGIPYVISPQGDFTEIPTGPVGSRPVGFFKRIQRRIRYRGIIRRAAIVTGLNATEVSRLKKAEFHHKIEPLTYGWNIPTEDSISNGAEKTLLILDPILPIAGCTRILKALAELGSTVDGWRVAFAGHSTIDPALEAAVARKGMADRVTFTKSHMRTRKELLGRARALASPWLRVAFPFSIMQAMAYGVPALCTDQVAMDGMGDAIRICKPDRDSLREGLRLLLSMSDAERMTASQRARDWAKKNLDWSVVAPRFAELYKSVL